MKKKKKQYLLKKRNFAEKYLDNDHRIPIQKILKYSRITIQTITQSLSSRIAL